jgi:hypothetical protein
MLLKAKWLSIKIKKTKNLVPQFFSFVVQRCLLIDNSPPLLIAVNSYVIGCSVFNRDFFDVRFFGINELVSLMSNAVLQAKIVARKYSRIMR